ncbi:hypothetical protein PFISCL1PPCAC_23444, partial [Pristionchus fissidentatus]
QTPRLSTMTTTGGWATSTPAMPSSCPVPFPDTASTINSFADTRGAVMGEETDAFSDCSMAPRLPRARPAPDHFGRSMEMGTVSEMGDGEKETARNATYCKDNLADGRTFLIVPSPQLKYTPILAKTPRFSTMTTSGGWATSTPAMSSSIPVPFPDTASTINSSMLTRPNGEDEPLV